MASTNKTTKLSLNQYVSTDKPTMADYNSDMLKIDNAVAGIIESKSNSNGRYIKFADGTMICTGTKSITGACTKAWGNMFESDKMDFLPFAQAFTALNHISISSSGTAAFIESSGIPAGQTNLTSPPSLYFVRPVSLASGTFSATYEAIGRWK